MKGTAGHLTLKLERKSKNVGNIYHGLLSQEWLDRRY